MQILIALFVLILVYLVIFLLGIVIKCRNALKDWVGKQGHDRCWYYPEIFNRLCDILGVKASDHRNLPPRAEFEQGCRRYQNEEYGS